MIKRLSLPTVWELKEKFNSTWSKIVEKFKIIHWKIISERSLGIQVFLFSRTIFMQWENQRSIFLGNNIWKQQTKKFKFHFCRFLTNSLFKNLTDDNFSDAYSIKTGHFYCTTWLYNNLLFNNCLTFYLFDPHFSTKICNPNLDENILSKPNFYELNRTLCLALTLYLIITSHGGYQTLKFPNPHLIPLTKYQTSI